MKWSSHTIRVYSFSTYNCNLDYISVFWSFSRCKVLENYTKWTQMNQWFNLKPNWWNIFSFRIMQQHCLFLKKIKNKNECLICLLNEWGWKILSWVNLTKGTKEKKKGTKFFIGTTIWTTLKSFTFECYRFNSTINSQLESK